MPYRLFCRYIQKRYFGKETVMANEAKYVVELTSEERSLIKQMLSKGKAAAYKQRHGCKRRSQSVPPDGTNMYHLLPI